MDIDAVWRDTGDDEVEVRRPRCPECDERFTEAEWAGEVKHECAERLGS